MTPSCSPLNDTCELPWKLILVHIPEASVEVLEADLNWQTGLLEDEMLYVYFRNVLLNRRMLTRLKRYTREFFFGSCALISDEAGIILTNYLTECALTCMNKLHESGHYENDQLKATLLGIAKGMLVFKKD